MGYVDGVNRGRRAQEGIIKTGGRHIGSRAYGIKNKGKTRNMLMALIGSAGDKK